VRGQQPQERGGELGARRFLLAQRALGRRVQRQQERLGDLSAHTRYVLTVREPWGRRMVTVRVHTSNVDAADPRPRATTDR
jgi:hypothetical protein